MRIPLIVGNWKMHKTIGETVEFCRWLRQEIAGMGRLEGKVETAVAPPFTALAAAAGALKGSPVSLCAQDVFWEERGAYTGEISPKMLADCGCRFGIVGHSERRQYFNETDDHVNRKAAALLKEKIVPIVCVGETLDQRRADAAFQVIGSQVRAGLQNLPIGGPGELVIAYEPVWAIGTGQVATPDQAQEVQSYIRRLLEEIFSTSLAAQMRILYGGSVKADNIRDICLMPDVDGALVGGASLEADSFGRIIRGAAR